MVLVKDKKALYSLELIRLDNGTFEQKNIVISIRIPSDFNTLNICKIYNQLLF